MSSVGLPVAVTMRCVGTSRGFHNVALNHFAP